MKYVIGQTPKPYRRDWLVIALIWGNAALILIAAWLWLRCYTGGN